MKKLRDIIKVNPNQSKGDQDFIAQHGLKVTPDKNGNGDDVFDATNVKKAVYPKSDQADVNESPEKDALRDMIAKKTAGAKVTKVPEVASRDGNISSSWRTADRPKDNKNVDDRKTVSKKTYLKTWKKAFAKEEVEPIDESVSEQQYEQHHKRSIKALKEIANQLALHKKWTKGQWGDYEIKELSRTLEDVEGNFSRSTEYRKPYVPSKTTAVK